MGAPVFPLVVGCVVLYSVQSFIRRGTVWSNMERASLKRSILDWMDAGVPDDLIDRNIHVIPSEEKVLTVTGLRRVGKTYLMFQTLKRTLEETHGEANVVYLNMEDERLPATTETLSSLIPAIYELFGDSRPLYLFVDEIQNIPLWSKWARRVHDMHQAHLIISGSSSVLSSAQIPTELRGREENIRVFPLSFADYLNFRGVVVDVENLPYDDRMLAQVRAELARYVEFGGLPEIVLRDGRHQRIDLLQKYFRVVVSRDIAERHNIRNTLLLKDLLRTAVESRYFSISKTYNVLKSRGHGLSKSTVARYMDFATEAYFLEEVPLYSTNVRDALLRPRKLYLADGGFITALSRTVSMGRLAENLVATEIQRRYARNYDINYWRGSQGQEVDFALSRKGHVDKLIQVCWDVEEPDTWKREVGGMRAAMKRLGTKSAIIVTSETSGSEGSIQVVPMWKWLLESDSA